MSWSAPDLCCLDTWLRCDEKARSFSGNTQKGQPTTCCEHDIPEPGGGTSAQPGGTPVGPAGGGTVRTQGQRPQVSDRAWSRQGGGRAAAAFGSVQDIVMAAPPAAGPLCGPAAGAARNPAHQPRAGPLLVPAQ